MSDRSMTSSPTSWGRLADISNSHSYSSSSSSSSSSPPSPSYPSSPSVQSTVLAIAGARVYHTKLTSSSSNTQGGTSGWRYSQWKGTLTFGRDVDSVYSISSQSISETERHWFRLADSETGRTVWMFKFPENFEYVIDRPFFHVFKGRTRRYGFLFHDDDEASVFGKQVFNQIYSSQPPSGKKPRKHVRSKSLSATPISSIRSSTTSTPMISSPAPNSFRHVSHVGVGSDGLFEATRDLDAAWKAMLSDLQGHSTVGEAIVRQHSDFADGFWKSVEAAQREHPGSISAC